MAGYFVTGTDTAVGKTWASVALLQGLKARGVRVAGMKPVATGAVPVGGRLCNDDALQLQKASSVPLTYEQVNPYAYAPPVSPHIAARLAGRPIEFDAIVRQARELESLVDVVVVEGVGGWEVPLGNEYKVSDLATEVSFPVILVVGLRLGCLNHAILTYEAIVRAGLECAGWIANQLMPEFDFVTENIEFLQCELPCHYLGQLPYAGAAANLSTDAQEGFPGNRLDLDEILRRFNG